MIVTLIAKTFSFPINPNLLFCFQFLQLYHSLLLLQFCPSMTRNINEPYHMNHMNNNEPKRVALCRKYPRVRHVVHSSHSVHLTLINEKDPSIDEIPNFAERKRSETFLQLTNKIQQDKESSFASKEWKLFKSFVKSIGQILLNRNFVILCFSLVLLTSSK